jgi:aspartate/methionine/tyrosine aminotransferase
MDLLGPEGAYAVLNKANALENSGRKIIHLEIGQPDFPTPEKISWAAIAAITKGLTKYNPPLGISELRERIAVEINQTKVEPISAKNVAVTPSGKTAIFIALSALIDKGDEVIYPNPGFPTYSTLIDYLGGIKKPLTLSENNNFSFDCSALKKAITKRTKVIILNSPSNPTGAVIPEHDLVFLADLIRQTGIWIVTDEIYRQLIYEGLPSPSFYDLVETTQRTILVSGFSKTYSMTGWRIGYLAAPAKIIPKIEYLLTHSVGCTATFTQYAALAGLNRCQPEVKNMVKEFELRRNYLFKELNKIPGLVCQKPAGAFYLFPNLTSFHKTSDFLANYLLEQAGVAVLSGSVFGSAGEGYLRLSYANSLSNLKKAVSLISGALQNL